MWDWKQVSDQERLSAATRGAARGAIVLGHDGFPGPSDGVDDGPPPDVDRAWLIREVLDEYSRAGLVGRSLGEAVGTGELVRRAAFRR